MNNTSDIKRAKKESLFFRAFSEIYNELVREEPQLQGIFINKVSLSKDKKTCIILFFCEDQKRFEEAFHTLILYKPSMRKGIAQKIASRYVPELRFAFDKKCDRQQNLEAALHEVSRQLKAGNQIIREKNIDDHDNNDDDTDIISSVS
jgi:ribosome-binding factor A